MKCQHHYCRCMRAAELAAMGMTIEAIEVHNQDVECRVILPSLENHYDQHPTIRDVLP